MRLKILYDRLPSEIPLNAINPLVRLFTSITLTKINTRMANLYDQLCIDFFYRKIIFHRKGQFVLLKYRIYINHNLNAIPSFLIL